MRILVVGAGAIGSAAYTHLKAYEARGARSAGTAADTVQRH
jgi:ketopantoate reductase